MKLSNAELKELRNQLNGLEIQRNYLKFLTKEAEAEKNHQAQIFLLQRNIMVQNYINSLTKYAEELNLI
jgi:translation initiation factor 2 beta subunit (eIF-2beta)/eIF-5